MSATAVILPSEDIMAQVCYIQFVRRQFGVSEVESYNRNQGSVEKTGRMYPRIRNLEVMNVSF